MQENGTSLSDFSVSHALMQLAEEEALAQWQQEIADYECPLAG